MRSLGWLSCIFFAASSFAAPKPVVLDVDPGIDDALALLLAVRSPEVDLRAVTVVFGNVEVELGVMNALKILELAGRPDIPVARGASRPIVSQPITAKNVHGANGLGNVALPEPRATPFPGGAFQLLRETLERSVEPVTLVPVGPLTNIALFLEVHPELIGKVREIVLMGGSTSVGTVMPTVSFNILNDPEAASVVFRSGIPITMVGFNVTQNAVLTPERLQGIAASDDPVASFVNSVVAFHRDTRKAEGVVVHDPLALAVAIDPTFVHTSLLPVDVELRGELTRGQTVVDLRAEATWKTERTVTTRVALEVDAERFLTFLMSRLGGQVGQSP